jgi:hypothetical protein
MAQSAAKKQLGAANQGLFASWLWFSSLHIKLASACNHCVITQAALLVRATHQHNLPVLHPLIYRPDGALTP